VIMHLSPYTTTNCVSQSRGDVGQMSTIPDEMQGIFGRLQGRPLCTIRNKKGGQVAAFEITRGAHIPIIAGSAFLMSCCRSMGSIPAARLLSRSST
jgi:hypothetical protein